MSTKKSVIPHYCVSAYTLWAVGSYARRHIVIPDSYERCFEDRDSGLTAAMSIRDSYEDYEDKGRKAVHVFLSRISDERVRGLFVKAGARFARAVKAYCLDPARRSELDESRAALRELVETHGIDAEVFRLPSRTELLPEHVEDLVCVKAHLAPLLYCRRNVYRLLLTALHSGVMGSWGSVEEHCTPSGADISWLPPDELEEGGPVTPDCVAPLVGGHTEIFVDDPCADACTIELDFDRIAEGLKVMCTQYPDAWHDLLRGNHDAKTANIFIQCCVFETVVFS